MNTPIGSFEKLERSYKDKKQPDEIVIKSADIFESLIIQNNEINIQAEDLIYDIDNISRDNSDTLKRNITFKSILTSLKLSISEYKNIKLLFEQYVDIYLSIYNEENTVKVLDILRQVISDRRLIMASITDNLIKLQRLTNERDKIDVVDEIGDDVENYLTPNTF
jgi:hypothetical protein